MTGAEVTEKLAKLKSKKLPVLLKLSLYKKRQIISDVVKYRSGEDSIGSVYMGGMALSKLLHIFGGKYGKSSILQKIKDAPENVLNRAIDYTFHYIDYMKEHPVKLCHNCGQIIEDN